MGDGNADVVDVRRLSLIDVSFEDDHLIETSPARPVGPQFLDDQSLEPLQGVDPGKVDKQGKKMASENLESFEERANKTPEHYHLRESLAWDSAFFTSDGVLEPEELTSMIEDAEKKKEKRTLPMILEETQRSTESMSTLASDSLTLTSLEGEELFEDIRASIQKSSKTSNLQTFGGKAGQSSFEAHVHHALRKTETDPASHGKLKPKPAPRKSSFGMIRLGKTTNQVPVHRQVSQVQSESVGGGSNSNSLPSKPPKLGIPSPTPSSTKRESMGVNHMKPEKNYIGGAITRGASEPKVPVSGGTRSIVPKSSSSRSSSGRSTSVETLQSDSSASGFSDKTGKSPTNLRSKGVDSRSRKLSSAGSFTPKTPLRSTPSRFSAHLVSTTKHSSRSPASSISEWSPESSSSTSAVKQRSNDSRDSLEPSSSEKTCDDGDNRQQLGGPKTHGSAGSTQRLKNASARGNLLPNSIGPSGLRMPSPKIGFFDGTKSVQAPNAKRQHQRVVPCALPEVGTEISRPDGSINKVKGAKFQAARNASAIGKTIGDSKHSSSCENQKSPPP